ncbi:unnamed protein product [Parnassius apollo]|uniref:(apollo) hypothetical protein n=1 Tax=Parnassius apollo TaxID=110799 RepID=A0A8S3XDU8_PARAO|nr:unnamed protein product [Parnassius apollo]
MSLMKIFLTKWSRSAPSQQTHLHLHHQHQRCSKKYQQEKNQTSEPSVASVLQKYMESRSSTITIQDIENPIYSFFNAMADSVVNLPPDLQLKAKNQIYLTVSNLKYENLQRKSTAGQTQNIQLQLDDFTASYLGEQFEEPTAFTSGVNEPQNTPVARTQTIHVPEVHTDSESQSILPPTKYILTADSRLLNVMMQEDTKPIC